MSGDDASELAPEKVESLKWRVRLGDGAPQKTVAIFAAGILAFGIGTILFRNPVLGLLGFAIIFGSTAEFWLGSSFSLSQKGATVRTGFSLSAIEWADVKRVVRDSGGIKLSPLEATGAMDAFRGVYLRFGSDNREDIERAVLQFGKFSDIDVVDRTDGRGDRSPD